MSASVAERARKCRPQKLLCTQCACCGIRDVLEVDYIVVGMGAAGAVVAARLAEDGCDRVLVVEAGPNNLPAHLSGLARDAIAVPALSGLLYDNPLGPQPSPSDLKYRSTPQGPSGARYVLNRGTGAGGSTNHHGMVDARGSKVVYDEIARVSGAAHWSYDALLPIFRRMENNLTPEGRNPKLHGRCGWLSIRQPEPEPGFTPALIRSAQAVLGAPFQPDINGDPRQAAGVGVVSAQVTAAGERSWAARDLLFQPALLRQGNLECAFNTVVARVLFDRPAVHPADGASDGAGGGARALPRASGVMGRQGKRLLRVDDAHRADTPFEEVLYRARKEVILSAGTFASPQTLMLSGVGPRAQLEEFKIPVVVDAPDVGRNLVDHLEVGLVHEMCAERIVWRYQACLALNSIADEQKRLAAVPPGRRTAADRALARKLAATARELEGKCDPAALTEPGFDVLVDWYSSRAAQRLDRKRNPVYPNPDLHIVSALFYFKTFDLPASIAPIRAQFVPADPAFLTVYHTCIIENLDTRGVRGTVRLQSADPTVPPLIDEALAENKGAVRRVARGVQLMRRVMGAAPMRKYLATGSSGERRAAEVLPGPHVRTRAEIEAYIRRESAFGHHAAGTCAMTRVVDADLRVLGVSNLRVVDLSVLPPGLLFAANPSRGVYAFAEQAARLILHSHRVGKRK